MLALTKGLSGHETELPPTKEMSGAPKAEDQSGSIPDLEEPPNSKELNPDHEGEQPISKKEQSGSNPDNEKEQPNQSGSNQEQPNEQSGSNPDHEEQPNKQSGSNPDHQKEQPKEQSGSNPDHKEEPKEQSGQPKEPAAPMKNLPVHPPKTKRGRKRPASTCSQLEDMSTYFAPAEKKRKPVQRII